MPQFNVRSAMVNRPHGCYPCLTLKVGDELLLVEAVLVLRVLAVPAPPAGIKWLHDYLSLRLIKLIVCLLLLGPFIHPCSFYL